MQLSIQYYATDDDWYSVVQNTFGLNARQEQQL